MKINDKKLFTWQECAAFDIRTVQQLYREYVSASQVELIGSFGFGRTTIVKAQGMYLYTAQEEKILDFTGGIGVLNHGHNHPRILRARQEFEEQLRPEVHKNYLSGYIAGLSHNIAQLLPEDLKVSYFCNSGAEAVEGAVKMAYKYHGGLRRYILHSDISFHGKLLGSAGLTGSPELHFKFPTLSHIDAFIYNDITSVKALIKKYRTADNGSDIFAIILEPFNASSLRESSTEFLKELRQICHEQNIILIFDEVYTGWAKCGELFYFMNHGIVPDILTYAKSFGGGKSSISGYTTRSNIFKKAYDNLNDATLHSTTYNGFGEECATAIEAINVIVEENFVENSKRIHQRLTTGLKTLQSKYPDLIKECRGKGALNGLIFNDELSGILKTILNIIPGEAFKDPRFPAKLITSSIISEMYNAHHILTFFGSNREIPFIISPSLIVTDQEIDYFLNALDKTLSFGKYQLLTKFVLFKYSKKAS